MKRLLSLILTVVMILGTLTALTSCGTPKNNGAEINIYLGSQVFDFDPSDYYVSSNAERVLSLIYEPLFTLKKNGKIKCAAAESYKVDKDERKIVIDLRESYWSDNIQVKAADFVYAWCERIINPVNPNPAAALFLEVEGVREVMKGEAGISDIGIKATEMDQITITYREGADYKRILKNLASVATSPVRQDVVESAETYWSKSSVVTNGAFKIKSYDKEDGTFELMRNVGYHQDFSAKDYDKNVRPGLLYGDFTFPDSNITVSYQDLKNKVTFVMADATLEERAKYEKKADTADHTSTYTYVFNTSHPLFAEAITFGKAADGFIPDVSGGSEESLISTGADLNAAKAYLAKANKAVVDANKSFTLTIDSDEQSKAIAEIVKAAWEKLGFSVTVNSVIGKESELSTGGKVTDSGIQYLIKEASYGNVNFDVIAVDWQMYTLDPIAGLASLATELGGMGREQIDGTPASGALGGAYGSNSSRSNITGWSDAKYDELILKASVCANKKERAKMLAEAEAYLISNMPVCPLVFNQTFVFTSSKISKLKFDGLGNLDFTNVKLGNYKKFYKPEETEE